VADDRQLSQAYRDFDVVSSDEAVGRFGEGGGLSSAPEHHVVAGPPMRCFIGSVNPVIKVVPGKFDVRGAGGWCRWPGRDA
jgi:hypothetical protein